MATPVVDPSGTGAPPSGAPSGEGLVRQTGHDFLLAVYRALRNLKLYPVENDQVQRSLDALVASAGSIFELEGEVELRVAGELIFVNTTRLRLDLDNYASFGHVLHVLREIGVGRVTVEPSVDRRQWQVFVALLLAFGSGRGSEDTVRELQQELLQVRVTAIKVEEPPDDGMEWADERSRKEVAKRTYERSIAVTKELVTSARMGRHASIKRVKRVVQNIVDQVLNNEVSLVGLTTLRDYDDYTFTHSVNVCIFSVSIGKRLGLSKGQLFDLGMAALVHDVGKGRVPIEVLTKQGKFSLEEWHQMQAHTWLGALMLFRMRGFSRIPYRSMITAYEHHMKVDGTGYPKSKRPRDMSMFAKIIAVADVFDAGTSSRVYKGAKTPDTVLREMWEEPRYGCDPVLVKALINLLGIYPVGTCVILDTYELAIVHAANPDRNHIHRPVVRVVSTATGALLRDGPLVDLAETEPDGRYRRSIIKVTDPAKYAIVPSDYIV